MTVIVGKINNSNECVSRAQVNHFVQWRDSNYLNLSAKKTKEVVIDFRRRENNIEKLKITDEETATVEEYKYLGVITDDKLTGNRDTKKLHLKCMQRIHFRRISKNLNVDRTVLSMFYKSVVESALFFC